MSISIPLLGPAVNTLTYHIKLIQSGFLRCTLTETASKKEKPKASCSSASLQNP